MLIKTACPFHDYLSFRGGGGEVKRREGEENIKES